MAVALNEWDAESEVVDCGRPSTPCKYQVSGGWNPSLLYLRWWFPGCVTDAAFSLRQNKQISYIDPPPLYKTKNPPLPISWRIISLINKKNRAFGYFSFLEVFDNCNPFRKKGMELPFPLSFPETMSGRSTNQNKAVCLWVTGYVPTPTCYPTLGMYFKRIK